MTREQVVNQALSHLRAKSRVSNLDTDATLEAHNARLHYDVVRRSMLQKYEWTFAEQVLAMAVSTGSSRTDWTYAYQWPANCLRPRGFQDGTRRRSRVPFVVGLSDDGNERLIFTDQASAVLVYTVDVTNTTFWPPLFAFALSWALAAEMAAGVTNGDVSSHQQAFNRAQQAEIQAWTADANMLTEDEEPDASWIEARQ